MPYFIDSKGVLAGADALRENGGQFSWDFLSTQGNPYNYPRLWAYAGWLGLGRAQLAGVGIAFAACLLICQYRLLRPVDGRSLVVAMLVLFSPACLLLLERGNNDTLVFALVMAATAGLAGAGAVRWGAGGSLLLAAACLKLFPIAAIAGIPVRRGWQTIVGVSVLMGAFALYSFVIREDFSHISAKTPRSYQGAYGGLAITTFVSESPGFRAALARVGVDQSSLERRAGLEAIVRNISYVAMLGLGGGALVAGMRSAGRVRGAFSTDLNRVRFRAGAAIYGGTFLIGNNWDYRLVFLGLTVPLLNGWWRGEDPAARRWARGVLALIIACLWAFSAPRAAWAFGLIQLASWALFLALAFGFGLLLPAELRLVWPNRPAELEEGPETGATNRLLR